MPETPVESLPSEILSEIFLSLIGHVWEARSKVTVGEVRTNLRLVSRLWNDIILSTPVLWTCIEIRVHNLLDDNPQFSTVKLLFERSGQLPLELDLNFLSYRFTANTLKHSKILMDILQGTLYRWQKVTLKLGDRVSYSFLVYRFSDATRLTHMSIIILEEELDYEEEELLIESLEKAPALRHLEYSGLNAPEELLEMPRVNQLTTLRLAVSYYPYLKSAVHVFDECPSLEWISLSSIITSPEFVDISTWPRPYLPNLRIFEIGELRLLPLFRSPNLQILSVVSRFGFPFLEEILEYIPACKHSLQVVRSPVEGHCIDWFFENEVLAQIPIVEVKTTWNFKVTLDRYRGLVLDRMWELFGDIREPTSFVADLTTYIGWVDPEVLPLFSEYFSGPRQLVLPPGTLSLYY